MKRQVRAPAAKAMAARWIGLRCRKLSGGVADASCSVAAADSEIRFVVSDAAMVPVFTGSDFGSTGSVLTIAVGSTVLAGPALVLEAVTSATGV